MLDYVVVFLEAYIETVPVLKACIETELDEMKCNESQ